MSTIYTVKDICNCKNCTKINSYDDDIGIIVQGPYNYSAEQLDTMLIAYKNYKNVFFIIHKNEPNLTEITKILSNHNSINYAICDSPPIQGAHNINMQTISTLTGLHFLQELGFCKAIKIRSDMFFYPLQRFLNNLKFDKLSFWCYTKKGFNIEKPPYNIHKYVADKYGKENLKFIDLGYPTDLVVSGPIEDMKHYFNFQEQEENYMTSPEYKLIINYLYKKGLPLNNSFEYLKKHVYFFKDILINQKIDWFSIKPSRSWVNYSMTPEMKIQS